MNSDYQFTVADTDLDQNNHMNHVQYIYYLEQARKKWYAEIGLDAKTLASRNIGTVVVRLETDFIKEAHYGAMLRIQTVLEKVGTKSFTFNQIILNEAGEKITNATVINVVLDETLRKAVPVVEEIAVFKKNLPFKTN